MKLWQNFNRFQGWVLTHNWGPLCLPPKIHREQEGLHKILWSFEARLGSYQFLLKVMRVQFPFVIVNPFCVNSRYDGCFYQERSNWHLQFVMHTRRRGDGLDARSWSTRCQDPTKGYFFAKKWTPRLLNQLKGFLKIPIPMHLDSKRFINLQISLSWCSCGQDPQSPIFIK